MVEPAVGGGEVDAEGELVRRREDLVLELLVVVSCAHGRVIVITVYEHIIINIICIIVIISIITTSIDLLAISQPVLLLTPGSVGE